MAGRDVLPSLEPVGTMEKVEDTEATRLMLETLFDIRAKVTDIHEEIIGPDDEDEEEEEDA